MVARNKETPMELINKKVVNQLNQLKNIIDETECEVLEIVFNRENARVYFNCGVKDKIIFKIILNYTYYLEDDNTIIQHGGNVTYRPYYSIGMHNISDIILAISTCERLIKCASWTYLYELFKIRNYLGSGKVKCQENAQ